jgi:5,10-methylenetetrahydrofolate reductase
LKAGSDLEKVFEAGKFAVTAEIGPPQSANPGPLVHHAKLLKGSADAFNLTDNQTAVVRLSSIASAAIIMREGIEPVIQMTCRDRNRIALQSDLLGASAIGVKNVLCLTGDHQTFGNEKAAKSVFDFDSISELYTFNRLRTEGLQSGGNVIEDDPPKLYLGCAENPFATPYEFRAMRLAKKINAGADFVQTQAIFDMDMFEKWMDEVRGRGLDKKVHIMAGWRSDIHEEQGAGDDCAQSHNRPHEEFLRSEGRGYQALRRADRGVQEHEGSSRRSHYGC